MERGTVLRASLGVSLGWIGIAMISDGLPALLLPHQLLASGRTDATWLGVTTLVAIAAAAAIQPAAGRASDRVGRGPVIAGGAALAIGGLGVMLVPGMAPPGTLAALCGVSVAQAGYQPLLPDRIGADRRGRAAGLKSAFDVAGAFLGFVVLAMLLGSGQPVLACLVLGATLIGGFGAAGLLLARPERPAPVAPVDEPAGAVPLDRSLLRLVVARFLFLLGIYAVGRFLLLFLAERFGLGADAAGSEAGSALAILALVTVLASLPSGWLADRVGRGPLMLAGGLVGGLGIVLLPAAGSLEIVLGVGALMAIGSAAFGSASWAMLADLTAGPGAGRLLGLANLGTAGAAAGAGAFGLLIDVGGYGPAFVAAAACALLGGFVGWRVHDELERRPVLIGPAEGAG